VIVAISVASSEMRRTPLVVADLLPAGFEIEAVLRPEDAGPTGAYQLPRRACLSEHCRGA
jgi:uncharacterized protein YfaS (alpha-2-macroglobulin family)